MAAKTAADFGHLANDYVSDGDDLVILGRCSRESPIARLDKTYSGVIIAVLCDADFGGYAENLWFKSQKDSRAY
jgi:hypothetical protein